MAQVELHLEEVVLSWWTWGRRELEKRTAQPPSFIEFHLETRPRARINEPKRFPS